MSALAVVEQEIARLEGYLDRAMAEVFEKMMGLCCGPAGEVEAAEGETVAALIGLAGALTGTVVVQCSRAGAMRACGALTGVESTEVDETVRDAMGELANIGGGGVERVRPGAVVEVPAVDADDRGGKEVRVVQPARADPVRQVLPVRGSCVRGDGELPARGVK